LLTVHDETRDQSSNHLCADLPVKWHHNYLLQMKPHAPKLLFFVTVDWFFCSHFIERAKAARRAGYDVVVLTRVDQHRSVIEEAGLRLLRFT
jgi:hypothetical protein